MFVRFRGRVVPLSVDGINVLKPRTTTWPCTPLTTSTFCTLLSPTSEKRLDADRFVRIHRSHIVNLDFVSALVPHEGGRIEVAMRGGARIMASRARSRELRSRTGGA